LERRPSLISLLSGLLVLTGSVQDGDADLAVRIDIGVEDRSVEFEGGRVVWVLVGECHGGLNGGLVKRQARGHGRDSL
jgi:hypothetical protein